MPKNLPNKKYVDSKSTELLLASQVIESSEAKAAKRPAHPPQPRQNAPRRKKSRKLDTIKLSIAQKERDRRSTRKKTRHASRSTPEVPNGTSSQLDTDLQGSQVAVKKPTPSKEHQAQRQRKRVAFA